MTILDHFWPYRTHIESYFGLFQTKSSRKKSPMDACAAASTQIRVKCTVQNGAPVLPWFDLSSLINGSKFCWVIKIHLLPLFSNFHFTVSRSCLWRVPTVSKDIFIYMCVCFIWACICVSPADLCPICVGHGHSRDFIISALPQTSFLAFNSNITHSNLIRKKYTYSKIIS